MKKKRKYWLGLAVAAGLVRPAWGQVPAGPPVPAAAVPVAGPGEPAPLPGGFLGNLITTCHYCKAKLCSSQIGQLMNNSLRPVSVFSGGLVGPLCPPDAVNPADLALPPDSAGGAAGRIKADQAGAAARRAAVRYLAHADCHYWPEAQGALIAALRADRNECVRWEAAMALETGCCCNPATILALSITVAGGEEDGNPSETSERVRAAASAALANCLSRVPPAPLEFVPDKEPIREREKEKERERIPPPREINGAPPAGGTGAVAPASYYQRAEGMSNAAVIHKARQALEQSKLRTPEAAASRANGLGSQGLVGLAMNALNSPQPSAPAGAADSAAAVPAPAPAVPSVPSRIEVVKDQQPALAPVPAPAHQPAVPQALPPIPAPAPAAAHPPHASHSAPAAPTVGDLTSILERGTRAADRSWAAAQLETVNWRANPQVILSLLTGARVDSEPAVRLACLGTLDRLNVDTPEAVTTFHTVAAVDGDARVRDAALHALAKLRPQH